MQQRLDDKPTVEHHEPAQSGRISVAARFRYAIAGSARISIYAFAVFGFLDLIGRFILFPYGGMLFGYALKLPGNLTVQDVVVSDDGAYKAIDYLWTGPAFDAGCFQMVSVVNALTPVQTAWTKNNVVFQTSCDQFFKFRWEPPANGRVKPRLRIDADAGRGDFMSRLAMSGRVAVAYQSDR